MATRRGCRMVDLTRVFCAILLYTAPAPASCSFLITHLVSFLPMFSGLHCWSQTAILTFCLNLLQFTINFVTTCRTHPKNTRSGGATMWVVPGWQRKGCSKLARQYSMTSGISVVNVSVSTRYSRQLHS